MRKILTFIAGTLIAGNLLAGGLVTNTNQSASWVRMPSRNATTEIDAVYNNPAGLMKMENGFHFSLNNQTIWQNRTITSSYPYLNNGTYKGTVFAPLFPSIYAAFKLNKFAFSFGFMPIGGGGGATYDAGLPSFEMDIADLVPKTASLFGTTEYDADISFEGSSVFFGYQANVSYKINDIISVAAGIRMVTAKNTYTGYLRDISINPNYPAFGASFNGSMVLASDFFTSGATTLNGLSTTATTLAGNINTAIGGGTPATTPLSAMPAALVAGVTQVLGAAGINATGMNIGTAAANLTGVAPVFTANATQMTENATKTSDIEVDAEETGMGYSPIISVNISPIENLNISVKYEFLTKLELTTSLAGPNMGAGIFIQDEKKRADMPAMLAVGANLKLSKLTLAAGGNYYFDKSADYGHKWNDDGDLVTGSTTPNVFIANSEIIEHNGLALHCAAELGLGDKILVSAGYAWANLGVNKLYQSDLTFANATSTIGLGAAYNITEKIRFNIGGGYTMYVENERTVNHFLVTTNLFPTETYTKNTMMLGLGLDLRF
jgi:long-chain fatty acid transport protein